MTSNGNPKPIRVELNWRLKTPSPVAIGPTLRTVLQVQAVRRQVTILTIRLDYPDFPEGAMAKAFLVRQTPCVGLRAVGCLREGESVCKGKCDFPGGPMDSWVHHNVNLWPHDYWQHVGPVEGTEELVRLERGECLGIVVQCSQAAACTASVGGL